MVAHRSFLGDYGVMICAAYRATTTRTPFARAGGDLRRRGGDGCGAERERRRIRAESVMNLFREMDVEKSVRDATNGKASAEDTARQFSRLLSHEIGIRRALAD